MQDFEHHRRAGGNNLFRTDAFPFACFARIVRVEY